MDPCSGFFSPQAVVSTMIPMMPFIPYHPPEIQGLWGIQSLLRFRGFEALDHDKARKELAGTNAVKQGPLTMKYEDRQHSHIKQPNARKLSCFCRLQGP